MFGRCELHMYCRGVLIALLIIFVLAGCQPVDDPCDDPRSLITGNPLPLCFIDCTATVSATNSEGSTIAAGESGQVNVQRSQSATTTSSSHKETSRTTN